MDHPKDKDQKKEEPWSGLDSQDFAFHSEAPFHSVMGQEYAFPKLELSGQSQESVKDLSK
jgi:hypothetical protein